MQFSIVMAFLCLNENISMTIADFKQLNISWETRWKQLNFEFTSNIFVFFVLNDLHDCN